MVIQNTSKFAPDEINQFGEYIKIGGSPIPGLTLRQILRGHKNFIYRFAWSPDGRYIASPSADQTIRIWALQTGKCIQTLHGHTGIVWCVAWSLDSQTLASSSGDNTIRLWSTADGKHIKTLVGHSNKICSVSWCPDNKYLASASEDGKLIIWDATAGSILKSLTQNAEQKFGYHNSYSVSWSPNGKYLISTINKKITLWEPSSGEILQTYEGHKSTIWDLAWSTDSEYFASASSDQTIRLWGTKSNQALRVLEGHSRNLIHVAFSSNSRWLASKGESVRLWRCDTWAHVGMINEVHAGSLPSIAFHPNASFLATLGENDHIIRIWEMDESLLFDQAYENINYTTAKVVLVGDSGVGKTGLGWRLAHGEFKEHASTHGQQFWTIPQLGMKRKDGTACEAVLWDLAGQHIYRQVHSIFLENVNAALVLFDPSNRQDPLKGAQFWLEQLKGKGQLPPTVLVGARVDRGAPALSQQELDQFCQRYGIRGGYISTSAFTGEGIDKLLEIVKKQIPWDGMTATVTTITFKRIKDYVLSLKEKPDRKGVLVRPAELRSQLEKTDVDWQFSDAEMMTAVGHLETHGYVSILRNSGGEQYILLTPELLVNLAASIMLRADKNPRELGAVSETELLQGEVPFDELKGLEKTEQQILTDAAILRFLEHNICFRETLGTETLLIFPSLIKQKRPLQDDIPATDDISYVVRGRVENLYPSLVVLLGYTPSFTRINQWQNQAQYEMEPGQVCGFRSIEEREGEIELVLYYSKKIPKKGREQFQELFEQFLDQREVDVTRFPPVICTNGHQQKRATIVARSRDGKKFVFCDECGDKVNLPDFEKPQMIGLGASVWLQREEAVARLRSTYEKHLTNIKSYRRGFTTPRCYISSVPEQAKWAERFVHDLQDAGVFVIEKAEQVQPEDFIVLLDTSAYRKAYQTALPALVRDLPLIQKRMKDGNKKLLALACEGNIYAHTFEECKAGEFCNETHYTVSLFDLILNLYAIPLNHAGFAPLRQSIHEQWELTLARKEIVAEPQSNALKIFISYSHKDEVFKDELVTMLAGLQRRGIVDTWHDRRIEAGDEWHKSIQNAMDNCDLALLLVSPDYLASRFIQEEEQPKLLQRRKEMETHVIPIIIRPCKWQSEEAISTLQVVPQDGKAVIKFTKENGDRDQVWADIATEIEKRVKEA